MLISNLAVLAAVALVVFLIADSVRLARRWELAVLLARDSMARARSGR